MALPQALGPQSQSGVTPITAPAPPASLQYRLSGGTYEKDQHNPCGIRAVGYVVLRAGTKNKERCAGVQSGTGTDILGHYSGSKGISMPGFRNNWVACLGQRRI